MNDRPSPPPLSWPPPGLEGLQGRLWPVTALCWLGAVVLVAPLLWALVADQTLWSLGPFEERWEVVIGLTIVGTVLQSAAILTLTLLLLSAARSADRGYGIRTIWEVLSDLQRDMGFLIQGKRHFGRFDNVERALIVRRRLLAAFAFLASALWLDVGFVLALLLGARGYLDPAAVALLTFAPSAVLLVVAAVFWWVQSAQVGRAWRFWIREQGGGTRVQEEMSGWLDRLEASDAVLGGGDPGQGRTLRRIALLLPIGLVVLAVPTFTVAFAAGIGPSLASTAIPSFLSVQELAGSAEVLRRYELPRDPSIGAEEAGFALQNLLFVGAGSPDELERAPRVRYEESFFTDPSRFPDPFSDSAAGDLLRTPWTGFSPEQQASLQHAAAHPAQAEFDRLVSADRIDIVATRWVLPFPEGSTVSSLPWSRFQAMRDAAMARLALAAVRLRDGEVEAAEQAVRETISLGFLLTDEGPTLIDNLMGTTLVGLGGDALEALYERAGRTAEAERIRWAREGARTSARVARVGIEADQTRTLLQGIPDLVERTDALRGMRWEYFATFNLLAPCINLQKMVFGAGEQYEQWMDRVEASLVRTPGERALFDLAVAGGGYGAADVNPGLLGTMLGITLGADSGPGNCAQLIASLNAEQVR